jgi:hypothetical protein
MRAGFSAFPGCRILPKPLAASYRLKLFDHMRVARTALRVCTGEFGALALILTTTSGRPPISAAVWL